MRYVRPGLAGAALSALCPAGATAANRPFGAVDDYLDYVVGKHDVTNFFLDPKLWVGLLLYVTYWAMVFTDRAGWYCTRWLEICSLDVLMLTYFQHTETKGVPLMMSVVALHFAVNSYAVHRIHRFTSPRYTAYNVYQDLRCMMGKVATVFVAQFLMVIYYLWSLTTMEVHTETVSYSFWATAFVAVQMGALFGRGPDSQLGFAFHGKFWNYLLCEVEEIGVVNDGKAEPFPISRWELWTRAIMAFLVNEVLRGLVGVSMPLVLMANTTQQDFLQDCLAAAFIFQLDDTCAGGTYDLVPRRDTNTQDTYKLVPGQTETSPEPSDGG